MQFFAAPLLGALSDRFGRRPVILASVAGIGDDYILLAFAPNLWWLFARRLIAGATTANVAAATAFIADVSGQADRSRAAVAFRRGAVPACGRRGGDGKPAGPAIVNG